MALQWRKFKGFLDDICYEVRSEHRIYLITRYIAPNDGQKYYPWKLTTFELGKTDWDRGEHVRTVYGSTKKELVERANKDAARLKEFFKCS